MEQELYHHGIKGMKWGIRRTPAQLGHKIFKKTSSNKSSDKPKKSSKSTTKIEKGKNFVKKNWKIMLGAGATAGATAGLAALGLDFMDNIRKDQLLSNFESYSDRPDSFYDYYSDGANRREYNIRRMHRDDI